MPPQPVATDEQIRALARTILERDEYARWGFDGGMLRAAARWLRQFLDGLGAFASARPFLYWAIVSSLLVLALLLLAHVVWTVRRALAASRLEAPRPAPATEPRFLEEAESLARAGRFLDAAHRVQLAAIDVLLRRRVLELARSDPNRTLRRRLREAALGDSERRDFLALLDRFETRWFRDRVDDRELYEAWRALHVRLCALPNAA